MKQRFAILLVLLFVLVISACGNTPAVAPTSAANEESASPTPMPIVTNTPDLCAPENIQAEVQEVHKFMREFDDGSSLAASIPADQLTPVISNLQRIRRDAEDLSIPPCLVKLKTYEINHMNLVIGTLINLIGYSNGTVSKDVIDQGIALARQEHDNYTIELATVLGLTPVVVTPAETPTPAPQ